MFERQMKLPSAEEITKRKPLPPGLSLLKRERDEEAKKIIEGKSEKLLVVVGPCSAHDPAPVLEYVRRLKRLEERVKERLLLIPRVYTAKPRTRGVGYKGMVSQPDPAHGEDAVKGILAIRGLLISILEETGLSSADEMLYPENYAYVEDLLSYVAVGARSCENQMHRMVASGIEVPVGVKNPMSGSIPALLNSVYAAQSPQVFQYHGSQVKTSGNPLAHAVLRGRVDDCGNDLPNYHYETVMRVLEGYCGELENPALIIDANHSNSGKRFKQQIRIVKEVLGNRRFDPDFKRIVKGFMIESFLVEGCDVQGRVFGQSITDPCLGWEDTERLLLEIAENV